MKRTKVEAEVTRQSLLDAALVVFSRKGYESTRLEDIAEEAGVTRGAIYHHFGSKPELFNTLVNETWLRVWPIMEKAMNEGGTVLDKLRRVMVRKISYVEEDPTWRAINELTLFKTARLPELEDGLQIKRDAIHTATSSSAAIIQQGIDEGLIRADIDPLDAAIAYYALGDGLLAIWLMEPTYFSLKARAEAMIDIFLQGLAAK